jgi:hypothetical protein
MAAEEYDLTISSVVADPDPAKRYVARAHYPASGRRIRSLEWSYARPGGCDSLSCELALPYDAWGLDYRTRVISQFQHVELRVRGSATPWWTGYVDSITPKLETPERIALTAKGYFHEAEKALISWTYSRQALKYAGDVGEIAGIVRSLFEFLPLLLGTEPNKPHPVADRYRIDASVNRPMGLVFDKVSVADALTELATLAGNYDWGVDEQRTFYFASPQTRSVLTALYGTDAGTAQWSSDPTHWVYGDETTQDPQAVPPYLPIEEQAVFRVGADVLRLEAGDTAQASKNVLVIIAAPREAGGQPRALTVADAQWIDYWGRRLPARVATPFFSEDDDLQRWGEQRLRLMGPPQSTTKATIHYQLPVPVHPTGAMRIIDPTTGAELVERIVRVQYRIDTAGRFVCEVEGGYQPPASQYFAEQLRRDATLSQNALAQERVPFVFAERMQWPQDSWTCDLT